MEITYASENQAEARFAPLIQDAFEQIGINVDAQADAVQPAVGARQG